MKSAMNTRKNKHSILNQAKLKKAQQVLGAKTETEAIERALERVISEAAPRPDLRLLMRAYDCRSASRSGAKVGRLENMAVGIYTTGKFQLVNVFLDTGHPRVLLFLLYGFEQADSIGTRPRQYAEAQSPAAS